MRKRLCPRCGQGIQHGNCPADDPPANCGCWVCEQIEARVIARRLGS